MIEVNKLLWKANIEFHNEFDIKFKKYYGTKEYYKEQKKYVLKKLIGYEISLIIPKL